MNRRFSILVCLALVLSGGWSAYLAAAQGPGRATPPAAKDAYVGAQLARLFAGAPVQVALRRASFNSLTVEASTPSASGAATNKLATTSGVCFLSVFHNAASAHDQVQGESPSFKERETLTKAGYDEFYSRKRGEMIEMIGRRGSVVVELLSSQPERFDAVFGAIATNLSAHPTMLSNLVHYAYTMHFGDPTPLHAILLKLNAKVPGLSAAKFPVRQPYGENAVLADYTVSSNQYELTIIAKAYDSVRAARDGQEFDSALIPVLPDKTEIVRNVKVHEYTRYDGIYFQTGTYTFRLTYHGRGALPFLPKVGSALIGEVNQANFQKESSL